MKNRLTDNLALAGYWNDFCFVCQEQTYQPEGFCSVCGWSENLQDYMTEEEYYKGEKFSDVVDRAADRADRADRNAKSKRAASK